jgi:hypothetical protein
MTAAVAPHASAYEARFVSLSNPNLVASFPCDAHGRVDLGALSSAMREKYLYVRMQMGEAFAAPVVVDIGSVDAGPSKAEAGADPKNERSDRGDQEPLPRHLDLQDSDMVEQWCRHFGATADQLEEAVKAAGNEYAAIREHLLNQGASSGTG